MSRTRTILTGGAIGLAAGAIAIAAVLVMQPPAPAANPAATRMATAEVMRGNLRDTKTVTGTLSYGELSSLRPSLSGSAMVTWLAPVGSTVERGQPIYALDGQPTLLLYGSGPQHRTLRFDADAEDPVWVELEQAQSAVEAAELTLELEQARLADAEARVADTTARLDDALSPTPATAEFVQLAGTVQAAEAKLARVKELAAAELTPSVEIASAESGLAAARAALDAAVRGLRKDLAASGLDAANDRVAVAGAALALDEKRTELEAMAARAPDDGDVRQLAENLSALGYAGTLAEQVCAWQRDTGLPVTGIVGPGDLVIASGPVHIAAHSASVGERLSSASAEGGAVLDYSSIAKLVTVPLAVADQRLAAVGRAVTITLPSDVDVEGTISEVGSVVTNGAIEVTVTIGDQGAVAGLEVASVDVTFVSDSRDDVLSVPIAALLARPEGGFAVEVIRDGASEVVGVATGLFAAGRVEVSGDGIAEGVRVGVPG